MGEKCKLYADIKSMQTEVTGSGNLIIVTYPDGSNEWILVDFGLYQGSDEQIKQNAKIGFDPKLLSAILVTHAHVDHIGRIPMLYKHGAQCKAFMTGDTLRVSEKLLENTAEILVNDPHTKDLPLYNMDDLKKALTEFRACDYNDAIFVTQHIKAVFIQNQHIPGAAMIYIIISYPGEKDITMLFSGDINDNHAFSDYQTTFPHYVLAQELSMFLCESTYGSRKRKDEEFGKFKSDIKNFVLLRKTIICTAFAYGRYQTILLMLKQLQDEGDIPEYFPIYLDGKLGCDITRMWPSLETVELTDFMPKNVNIVSDRKALMSMNTPKIIITTSGMGNFGPAKEYITHYIQDENAVIYIPGYTSPDSNAGRILNAEFGDIILVSGIIREKKALVMCTGEFSSHAKKNELISYISQPKKIGLLLLNHGNLESKYLLSLACHEKCKNVKDIGILDGKTVYRINAYGFVKSY